MMRRETRKEETRGRRDVLFANCDGIERMCNKKFDICMSWWALKICANVEALITVIAKFSLQRERIIIGR